MNINASNEKEPDTERQERSKEEVSFIQSHIDTKEAHECLFQWLEKQSEDKFARDHFYINKITKKYYGCIGFWFRIPDETKGGTKVDEVVIVPGCSQVPQELIKLSVYYKYYRTADQTKKDFTPINITEDEAEPKAYELLKTQNPSAFDENGNFKPTGELIGTFLAAVPLWEGTYNSKYGKEHKFYIDAQTGETIGDLYIEKAKGKKKNKDEEQKAPAQQTQTSEEIKNEKNAFVRNNERKENNDDNDDEEEETGERKRYILLTLIIVAAGILCVVLSKIFSPPPSTPPPNFPVSQTTEQITAPAKPKPTPLQIRKEENETEKPEETADKILKLLAGKKYEEVAGMISSSPDFSDQSGDRTKDFSDAKLLADYYSKTSNLIPEKTSKLTTEENSDNSGTTPGATEEKNETEVKVQTSYVESGSWNDSGEERTYRGLCVFTLVKEDGTWKIKNVNIQSEQIEEKADEETSKTSSQSGQEQNYSESSDYSSGDTAAQGQGQDKTADSPQIILSPQPIPDLQPSASGTESGSAGGSVE